jgi:hypothetical protein
VSIYTDVLNDGGVHARLLMAGRRTNYVSAKRGRLPARRLCVNSWLHGRHRRPPLPRPNSRAATTCIPSPLASRVCAQAATCPQSTSRLAISGVN